MTTATFLESLSHQSFSSRATPSLALVSSRQNEPVQMTRSYDQGISQIKTRPSMHVRIGLCRVQGAFCASMSACMALLRASPQDTCCTVCSYHCGGEGMRPSKSRGQIRWSKQTVMNCSGQSSNHQANNNNNRKRSVTESPSSAQALDAGQHGIKYG